MRATYHRIFRRIAVVLAAGTTFFLSGCDPELRATVEDGIISVSQSLLGSFMQAIIQVLQESNTTT